MESERPSAKHFLVKAGIEALKTANNYDKVVNHFVHKAEIIAMLADLSDEEMAYSTFLGHLEIGEA